MKLDVVEMSFAVSIVGEGGAGVFESHGVTGVTGGESITSKNSFSH
jgi:hypothetical protein